MTMTKLNATEKATRNDIKLLLTYLNGRLVGDQETLKFMKELDSCQLEDVVNRSRKAIYTVQKDDFWQKISSKAGFGKFLEKKQINSYQELEDQANIYYVMNFNKDY